MIKFDKEKVLLLQQLVIESSGGSVGIRDLGLLDSAIESAFKPLAVKNFTPRRKKKAQGLGLILFLIMRLLMAIKE